jgi:heme oxygenase
MGALYVIEGSALGGAVLARVAKRALGLTSLTGAGFFAADADLSRRWKLVVTSLEHQATIDGSEPIIAGAVDTFDCMEGWLWP